MSAGAEPRGVLVTRAEDDAETWAEALRARGLRPVLLPCIRCEALTDGETRGALAAALDGARWLVFGSRRGVEAAAALLDGLPEDLLLGAVGPRSAEACQQAFGRIDLVAPAGTGRSLGEVLRGRFAVRDQDAGPVIFAGADRATRELDAVLEPAGVELRRIVIYRTVPAAARTPRLSLAELGADAVLLASPSAVEGLLAQVDVDQEASLISIGPSTTKAIEDAGYRVAGEAETRDIEGMLEALR